MSPLNTTRSAGRRSPLARRTPTARPPLTSMRSQGLFQRNSAPRSRARRAIICARACMPPSTDQTPSISTWAMSINVAGASQGDEPQ